MHAGICQPATTQHDTPLLTVFYCQPTPTYVSWEVDKFGEHRKKKGDIKDVRHFDNHFKAFIAFCTLARLSLGFWDFFDVENFQEKILLTLEPVFRPSYPTHSPPLYLVCIYSPSMLCLRLQLYSFVFNRSLATCVSPCLYLTILSGIQGMGTEGGGGVCGGRVA